MNTLISFKSYLGASEQYAKWICEKTGCDLLPFSETKNNTITKYDTIVVVSGTYVGHMPLVRFLTRHWKSLKDKNVVAVAVGAAPAQDAASIKSYEAIPKEIRNAIKYFKLPSSIEKKGREALKKSNVGPVVEYIRKLK